jgi:hypothetical protein
LAAVFVDDAACGHAKIARPYQAEKWVCVKCFCNMGIAGAFRAGFISKGHALTPIAEPETDSRGGNIMPHAASTC